MWAGVPPLLYVSSHWGWLYSEKKNRSALVPEAAPCPGQFMLGMPSERKPCAQSSQLLVLVVSINVRDTLPSGAVPSLYRLTVTPGTSGVQLVWISSVGSSNGRVEATITSPKMQPVSPAE